MCYSDMKFRQTTSCDFEYIADMYYERSGLNHMAKELSQNEKIKFSS